MLPEATTPLKWWEGVGLTEKSPGSGLEAVGRGSSIEDVSMSTAGLCAQHVFIQLQLGLQHL